MQKGPLLVGSLLFFISTLCVGSDSLKVHWGAYVDTYYALDLNQPAGNARNPIPLVITTQASRHNEFNVNLAFVEAKISSDRLRGRLALQTGTSVPANYVNEGTNIFLQVIQEAVAGYRVAEHLWLEAGIYFSPIGLESWISRDNWTYTRSLMSDFSPYYQSGARIVYDISPSWSAQINVVNGWQNITETNHGKAMIFHLAYQLSDQFNFAYNNYYGLEVGNLPRLYNELIAKLSLTQSWKLAGAADFGLQRKANESSFDNWYQYTLLTEYKLTPTISFAARAENYVDRNQIIVPTHTPNGFQTYGASVGFNAQLQPQLLFRSEFRALWSKDPVFLSETGRTKNNQVFVLALNLTL